jgi:hypothetical protein
MEGVDENDPDGVIDCGPTSNPTVTGDGTVGGPHNGAIVPHGIEILTPGMGPDGGGKVFHTPNPNESCPGASPPTGQDNTLGCVAVSCKVLTQLSQCEGASLHIDGTGSGGGSSGGSAPAAKSGGSVN